VVASDAKQLGSTCRVHGARSVRAVSGTRGKIETKMAGRMYTLIFEVDCASSASLQGP
jgi:hypothetical protein